MSEVHILTDQAPNDSADITDAAERELFPFSPEELTADTEDREPGPTLYEWLEGERDTPWEPSSTSDS